jgi:hypothetical protein
MYFLRRIFDALTYPLWALLSTPSRILSGSHRLRQIPLPARVAALTALVLIICVGVTILIFRRYSEVFVQTKLNLTFYLVVGILVIVIPIVLYKVLQIWLEGEISPYPDINHAWKTGLDELHRQGIDLSKTPLFLLLGSASEWQEKAVFDAARLSLNVRETPKGPAPLHWYGSADGVYLVCSDACCLSKLGRLSLEAGESRRLRPSPVAAAPSPAASLRGTIIVGRHDEPGRASPAPSLEASGPSPEPSRPVDIRAMTMILPRDDGDRDRGATAAPAQDQPVRLPPRDADEQGRRLNYLCRLIRRIRQPLCPVNGVVTLLPFDLIQRTVSEAAEVLHAVQRDLASLRRGLGLRSPVTAMVTGLENETGFRELVRRVGRDRALAQRFGKGFSLTNPPIDERLEALGIGACGAFEDWCYALFREKDALSKPGNTKLYGLLCKIRRDVQSRLADILANGYGYDPDNKADDRGMFFGGCYFAAAGDTEDRQAFVKAVFDKLPEQQEELEWTEEALRQDRACRTLASVGFGLSTVLLLALAVVVVSRWW